jgi:septum site-determining protein MinC
LIDQPVRSGQRIYAPNCDLIVTSHVSAGAELIADGNIHVYGMMRGRALAQVATETRKYFVLT